MNNELEQLDVSASEEGEQAQAIALIREAQALAVARVIDQVHQLL